MTNPGGGFEYSSDGESVVAKLSIDIPQEGLQSLREMTTETNRYKVELEAATRLGKDFTEYLRQLPQIQAQVVQWQKNIVEQLQRTIDVQKQMMAPGSQIGGTASYSPGTSQLASDRSARPLTDSDQMKALGNKDGRDIMRGNSMDPRAGATAGNPNEDAITQADTRQVLRNAVANQQQNQPGQQLPQPPHQRSGVGEQDYDSLRSKIAGSTGGLSAIMNELEAGGGGGAGAAGLLSTLGRSLGGLGAEGGLLSSLGLGGVASAAGPIGAGLAAAGAGLWAFQEGGQMVEGYRQMGQMRGGGAGEGLGYEMAIRSMALNPFLTTDQARKIVQTGLQEGYTGKEFDTVTQFVAENLKNMNTDITTSFSLMKKNILEGGMTVPGVQADLQDLATMSKMGGYQSVPELQANYAATSQALLAAGVPASEAARTAKEAGQLFKGIPILEGSGNAITQIATTNPELLYMGARMTGNQFTPGSLPNTMSGQLPNGGEGEIMAVIKMYAQRALQSRQDKRQAVGAFMYMLQGTPGLAQLPAATNFEAAVALMDQVMGGGDPMAEARKVNEEAGKQNTSVQDRSDASQTGNLLAGTAMTMIKGVGDIFTGHPDRLGETWQNELYGAAPSNIPRMDALVAQYGVNGIEVVDSSGQTSGFNPNSRKQLEAISSGDTKVKIKGTDTPIELSKMSELTGDDLKKNIQNYYGNPTGLGNPNVNVQGAVQINVNPPEMAKALGINQGQSIQLSPNKVQAMQGWGNGQTNMPVPGY